MYFASQEEFLRYHSPEQRQIRSEEAKRFGEVAVSEALNLFNSGDVESARQRLFEAGIQEEGIACYLNMWRGSDPPEERSWKRSRRQSEPGF